MEKTKNPEKIEEKELEGGVITWGGVYNKFKNEIFKSLQNKRLRTPEGKKIDLYDYESMDIADDGDIIFEKKRQLKEIIEQTPDGKEKMKLEMQDPKEAIKIPFENIESAFNTLSEKEKEAFVEKYKEAIDAGKTIIKNYEEIIKRKDITEDEKDEAIENMKEEEREIMKKEKFIEKLGVKDINEKSAT